MLRPRFPFIDGRLARQRGVVTALLAMVIAAIVGIPSPPPRKPTQERFPCENCPCGCSTADFCWDQCCCLDDREKLAWAEENDVEPPEFLVARVQAAPQLDAADHSALAISTIGKSSIVAGEEARTDKRAFLAERDLGSQPVSSGRLSDSHAAAGKKCCGCCGSHSNAVAPPDATPQTVGSKNPPPSGFCGVMPDGDLWEALPEGMRPGNKNSGGSAKTDRRPSAKTAPSFRLVLAWKTAQCRGLEGYWSLLSQWVVDVDHPGITFSTPPGERLAMVDHRAMTRVWAPDPPVPWSRGTVLSHRSHAS